MLQPLTSFLSSFVSELVHRPAGKPKDLQELKSSEHHEMENTIRDLVCLPNALRFILSLSCTSIWHLRPLLSQAVQKWATYPMRTIPPLITDNSRSIFTLTCCGTHAAFSVTYIVERLEHLVLSICWIFQLSVDSLVSPKDKKCN